MTAYASHRCFSIGGSDRRPRARVRVIARVKRAYVRRGSEKVALAVVGSLSRALSTAQRAAVIAMRRPGSFVVEPETRERMWNRYVINRLTTRQLLKTHRQPVELGLRRAEHYEWFPTGITVSGRSGPFVTVVSPSGDLRKAAKSGRSATTPYTYFSSPVHRLPSAFCTGAGK